MIFCQTKYIGFLFYLFCQIGPSKLNLIFYLSLVMCWIVCSNLYFFSILLSLCLVVHQSDCLPNQIFSQFSLAIKYANSQLFTVRCYLVQLEKSMLRRLFINSCLSVYLMFSQTVLTAAPGPKISSCFEFVCLFSVFSMFICFIISSLH